MIDIKAYAVVFGIDRYDYIEQGFKVYKTLGAARAVARRMDKEPRYGGIPQLTFVKIVELLGNEEVSL